MAVDYSAVRRLPTITGVKLLVAAGLVEPGLAGPAAAEAKMSSSG